MRLRALFISAVLMVSLTGCKKEKPAPMAPEQVITLDSTVVNLADVGSPTYLRLGLSMTLAPGPELSPQASNLVSSVARDTVVSVVSAHTAASLLTPDGKTALKHELLEHIRQSLPGIRVEAVLFDEFLIQQ